MKDFLESPVGIIISLAILVSAMAWPVTWYHVKATEAAIAAGLVEVSDSASSTHWAKP